MTCQNLSKNSQENIKVSFEIESPTKDIVNGGLNDNCFRDDTLGNSLHANSTYQDNISNLFKKSQTQKEESSISSSDIEKSKSVGNQLAFKRDVANDNDDNVYYCNNVVHDVNDFKLTTNYSPVQDLCTLLSLEALNKHGQDDFSIEINKMRKEEKELKDKKNANADFHLGRSFCREKSSGILNIVETQKMGQKHSTKTGNTHQKTHKTGHKKKRKLNRERFPYLPPLLSLGVYDDINISMEDTLPDKKSSKPIVTYYNGSLIYSDNKRSDVGAKNGEKEIKKNDSNHLTYKAGQYDNYLEDQNTSATKTRYSDHTAFAGMQYAIRKELDKALQRDEIKQRIEKPNLESIDDSNSKLHDEKLLIKGESVQNTYVAEVMEPKNCTECHEDNHEESRPNSRSMPSQIILTGSFKNTMANKFVYINLILISPLHSRGVIIST